ncbi:ATP-binding protein [Hephaestia sp. GCM10023244]|uniref:PAS domain-containing sensor histidine kinase n=1 Tax=unclassified Hephaestia TaxID=2631281 RepID=UPI002076DB6C|nr:PAS domain-containing sensor histidine kinase [Hephaestia sp. MAHUQ-44]MCM8731854.1 PAS domain S-box protein [Hephaestia sp. MAHUQ-44]
MTNQASFDAHLGERRFQRLVNSVTEYAIYMLDTGGYVRNWNVGAEAIKGYSEAEIVGEHFSRFYTPEDRANGVPELALATALRDGKYEDEAWRVRKDGTRFWAHAVLDPIYDDNGTHIGFAKITRDITDRWRAQHDLEEARLALFQAQKLQALGELTGGIAHDFNNLLTVMRGAAELLRNHDMPEEKRRRYADNILETADRAADLTSRLLSFGRRQALKFEVVDLQLRLDAFAEMLERTIGAGIAIRLETPADLWRVRTDSTQLEAALLNAAINARDAMPQGGTITISASNSPEPERDMVCIAVSDDGPGMPEEVLARAFEPFFTTKPVGQGTGLGLPQLHGFAAQSGGRGTIESSAQGTVVRIVLPRAVEAASPASSPTTAAATGAGQRVLVVDDNDHVREFARDLLDTLGYRARTAASADEALAMLATTEDVDVLFSDVVMPGMSGIALAGMVRARHPGLPILLASGYSLEVIEGAAADFALIAKPYTGEALGRAIHALVSGA